MPEGRFITLEGGEGTGKSTLLAGLVDRLSNREIPLLVTREPGGTMLAEVLRELVLHPPDGHVWSPLAQALMMNAARAEHLQTQIRPALREGRWVLCDRFADSTRAYQGIGGVGEPALMAFERAVVDETIPDLTFILDGAPAELAERRSARGTSDMFEAKDLAFHDKVRAAFLAIAAAEPQRCVVLDALQPPEAVLNQALAALEQAGLT